MNKTEPDAWKSNQSKPSI